MQINYFQNLTLGVTVHRSQQNNYEHKGNFSAQNSTFGC